jgi:hypothetical protein
VLTLTQIAVGSNGYDRTCNAHPLVVHIDPTVIVMSVILIGIGFWIGVL